MTPYEFRKYSTLFEIKEMTLSEYERELGTSPRMDEIPVA